MTRRPYARHGENAPAATDAVAVEAPLEIRLEGTPIAVVMRTPGHDPDLIRGFVLTEGIFLAPSEIHGIARSGDGDDDRWDVQPAPGVIIDPERFRRNLYATSSCGVCGKASIDAVRVTALPPDPGPTVRFEVLTRLPAAMRRHQPGFDATGGLHAAAIFDPGGELLSSREDIGRHNAVDKTIGSMAVHHWPLRGTVLFVSGRVSFEIVQKAAVAGVPIVAGVSAASSLAIDLAAELGMTLAAFVRDDACNVYSGRDRIT